MSGEIEVPETPNWLQSLEEKRERRLKARLGHEAGAGAPCLKCGDKCPGLDLHFWRKACKICRCPKEEHDVHDDDIYGWAQFQLLGSKPNKIKTKIVLPGKKDEVELEWAPKGQKETIDKYLKTLPPEALPVKGSQAAQERKQMLQKQIPIHDIDPALCHELNEEEVKKMEEYIAHIKKSSVGVGQIVNLSSVIKANLHNISPQEAHIIASRYSKGIPFSEIIKLQSGLAKNLEKLTINDRKSPSKKLPLPNMQPSKLGSNISEQDVQNPLVASKIKDITHPWYTDSSPHKGLSQPQYSQDFKSGQQGGLHSKHPDYQGSNYAIDQKLLQGTNFDPSKTPSQFLGYHTPGYRPVQYGGPQPQDQKSIPYDKESSGPQGTNVSSSRGVDKFKGPKSGGWEGQPATLPYNKVYGGAKAGDIQNVEVSGPNYSQNLSGAKKFPHTDQYGFENPYFNQNPSSADSKYPMDNATPLKPALGRMPGYSPSKYDPQNDIQNPKAPKSMKDLMYSTYDPSKGPLPEDSDENTGKNKNIDSKVPEYDPNVVFNTYKHDPSVIRYENPPLLNKNDPAQPIMAGKVWQGRYGHGHPNYNSDSPHSGYIDPKTGTYIPGVPETQQEKFGPGNPQYDPQDPYFPVFFDPKTEKYIIGNNFDPKKGTFVPKNFGHEKFAPGHPNYDPKDTQNPLPVYYDPKTGKYIKGESYNADDPINPNQGHYGPGHPNFDPQSLQNPYLPVYFDPKTGKCFTEDGYLPEEGHNDPSNTGQANFGPGHPNYDIRNSGRQYDPKTGTFLPVQEYPSEFGHYDTANSGYGPGHPNYDPNNPQTGYVDPKTGKFVPGIGANKFNPINPSYGPGNSQKPIFPVYYDPKTEKYIIGEEFDPKEGTFVPKNSGNPFLPVFYDPTTGEYIKREGYNPKGHYGPGHPNYDPKNPQNPHLPVYFDPITGKCFTEDGYLPEEGHYDPSNPGHTHYGPGHPNIDIRNSGRQYDPKTGTFLPVQGYPSEFGHYDTEKPGYGPGHPNYDPNIPQTGYVDPKTGKFVPGIGNNPDMVGYDPRKHGPNKFDPRNPSYGPVNLQKPIFPVYYDPKTEKYIIGEEFDPKEGTFVPKNSGLEKFSPGHPKYDPKNSGNPFLPVFYDPTTGECIKREGYNPNQGHDGPGHANYDPKNRQNLHLPVYFDPDTGKCFTKDGYLPEDSNYDPRNAGQGHFGPGHPNYDLRKYGRPYDPNSYLGPNRPQNIPGIDHFDPNNPDHAQYLDPRQGNLGKFKKPLSHLQPGHINVPEDYLEPHMVNVGAIQDINPEIRAATTETNPGFDNESVYSDNGAEYSPESIREILNNIKLPDCHYCKKPFEENEYAVTVDRANVLFHAQCFKCAGCNQSLADNIYFYHKETNNVYCGRDYAKIKGYPRCTACDELIFTKEYCLAENSTFHLKHFCCFQCDTPLAGQDYTLEDEMPYCLPCYETSKAAKCSTCERVIKPDEVGCQLNGVHFHAEDKCFRCIVCSVPLMGKKLLLRNEKLYCSHDCFNSVKK